MIERKSPLKDAPLRNPGQSVEEEIQRVVDDQMFPAFITAFMFLVITLLE